ncbi:MAG: hypothetical protein WBE48_23430, partial [Xanthobacteraceae bacterium]
SSERGPVTGRNTRQAMAGGDYGSVAPAKASAAFNYETATATDADDRGQRAIAGVVRESLDGRASVPNRPIREADI